MDMESLRFSIQKGIEMRNNVVNVMDENNIEVDGRMFIAIDSYSCAGCHFYIKGDGTLPCKFYDLNISGYVTCLSEYRTDKRSIAWVPASYPLKYC